MSELRQKAKALRALHVPGTPLVLPNAWNVASARIVEDAGFPAIATTSGGIAASLGYEDGEMIPAADMLAAVARIASAVEVPVTADLESGYGMPADEFVAAMLSAGAVGMNFEDSHHSRAGAIRDAAEQASRISAIKEAGRTAGVDVVLNARIDVYLPRLSEGREPSEVLADALDRAKAYRGAGADCVFPIFCRDENHIETLAQNGPVNVLAIKGAPSLSRLKDLGVARVSFGSGLMRYALERTNHAIGAIAGGQYPWD